jgi:hypothetical protein
VVGGTEADRYLEGKGRATEGKPRRDGGAEGTGLRNRLSGASNEVQGRIWPRFGGGVRKLEEKQQEKVIIIVVT